MDDKFEGGPLWVEIDYPLTELTGIRVGFIKFVHGAGPHLAQPIDGRPCEVFDTREAGIAYLRSAKDRDKAIHPTEDNDGEADQHR